MSNSYYFIANRDGSQRWVWPVNNERPSFLNFYNSVTFKQKVFRLYIQLIFRCKLQKNFFKTTDSIDLVGIPGHNRWALFYGTPGPNNKKILFEDKDQGLFTKIATSESSVAILQNEQKVYQQIGLFSRRLTFLIPELKKSEHENELTLGHLAFEKGLPNWTVAHTNAILDLSIINAAHKKVDHWSGWKKISQQISELSHFGSNKIPLSILNKLILLKIEIDRKKEYQLHAAHGDFTPWNVFQTSGDKLAVLDWELYQEMAPKGFDSFHFHIQKGILVERKKASSILSEIRRVGVSSGLFADAEELNQYLKLYLLQHISYYAVLYGIQSDWHTQIYWQLQVWEELLNESITIWNDRKLFITDVFEFLKNKPYAGLKLHAGRPEDLHEYSDIDLLVQKTDLNKIVAWIKSRENVQKVIQRKRSHVSALTLIFRDGTRLYLDLLVALKRKQLIFQDERKVIKGAKTNYYGVKEAAPKDTAFYIGLFYALNGKKVPAQYAKKADCLLPAKTELEICIYKYFCFPEQGAHELLRQVKSLPQNNGWKGLRNSINYWFDTIWSVFKSKGLMVTLSGVDGAGKTTVIEELKYEFDKKYRKPVVVLRHRPSLIPILSAYKYGKKEAEQRSVNSLPRQGENRSTIGSLARFMYYYADYFFGQFYIYGKYILRGYVVIYDRYYFDLINDSKRSNMTLPKSLTKLGYRFLLKPDYNFFLYANPDIILERKQELDRATIHELTFSYKNLFQKLQGRKKKAKYISINNEVLVQTKQRIFQTIGNLN